MFGRYAKRMTECSNHYLDWSRTGELLLSASHRYSRDELLVRGFIAVSIAVSAYLGATQNNQEKSHCSSTTMAIAAGLFGFVVSHAIVLIPLVQKRREMSSECQQMADKIKQEIKGRPYSDEVSALVEHILKFSLSNEQHGNASLTWGTRKRLLVQLVDLLNDNGQDDAFWQDIPEHLMDKLQGNHVISVACFR